MLEPKLIAIILTFCLYVYVVQAAIGDFLGNEDK